MIDTYKIAALRVRDFKRIREIALTPDADAHVILLGGKNAAGKSSVLDSIEAAIGGADVVPMDPVRHGADDSEILVDLQGKAGTLSVRRRIRPDRKTQLELRANGTSPVAKPQSVLDAIIGARFLDPVAWLAQSAAAQRGSLLELLPVAKELEALAARHDQAFGSRTNVGRELRRVEGEIERMPPLAKAPDPIDTIEVLAKIKAAQGVLGQHSQAGAKIADARRRYVSAKADVDRLRAELAAAEQRLSEANAAGQAAAIAARELPSAEEATATIAALEGDLQQAQAVATARAAAQAEAERRARAKAELDKLVGERDTLTKEIEAVAAAKDQLLASAALPVPGLGVTADGVTLNGIPLEQASSAERLRVALAIAIATSPHLRAVWIRDGSLLDDDSLAAVAGQAEAADVQVWIERVGSRDPGAIVIVDGEVAS